MRNSRIAAAILLSATRIAKDHQWQRNGARWAATMSFNESSGFVVQATVQTWPTLWPVRDTCAGLILTVWDRIVLGNCAPER
jgi:hypothetical protein